MPCSSSYIMLFHNTHFMHGMHRISLSRSMILTALAPQRIMTLPMLLPAPIPHLKEGSAEGSDGGGGGGPQTGVRGVGGVKVCGGV